MTTLDILLSALEGVSVSSDPCNHPEVWTVISTFLWDLSELKKNPKETMCIWPENQTTSCIPQAYSVHSWCFSTAAVEGLPWVAWEHSKVSLVPLGVLLRASFLLRSLWCPCLWLQVLGFQACALAPLFHFALLRRDSLKEHWFCLSLRRRPALLSRGLFEIQWAPWGGRHIASPEPEL